MRRYLIGALAGAALVLALQVVLDRTPLADWIVAPLLVNDTSGSADAMVVLGAGVTEACTPNIYTQQRVMLAVRLFKQGRAPVLVMSGGATNGRCSVGSLMADFAREVGVPADRVRVEGASLNTYENAVRGAVVLNQLGAKRVLLVTDKLHMRRAEACFVKQGFHPERASVPLYQAYDSNVDMLVAAMYELSGWYYYRLRGRIG